MLKKIATALAVLPMLLSPAVTTATGAQSGSAHDFTFTSIDGKPMPLSQFRGKAVLVVNTASFCGYTPQYTDLQALYAAYEARGLVVLGVPSNDFGAQEPKSNGDIAEFCQGAFNVTFPLTEKQVVCGERAHPFYRWAHAVLGDAAAPKWNFHKYLVGRDGRLIAAYSTQTEPRAPKIVAAIEAELAK